MRAASTTRLTLLHPVATTPFLQYDICQSRSVWVFATGRCRGPLSQSLACWWCISTDEHRVPFVVCVLVTLSVNRLRIAIAIRRIFRVLRRCPSGVRICSTFSFACTRPMWYSGPCRVCTSWFSEGDLEISLAVDGIIWFRCSRAQGRYDAASLV